MVTTCFTPILGKRIRVTMLDDCGNVPAPGTEDAYVSTDGFISVNITAETEDGTEIITKKANGQLCVNEKQANSLKRLNLEIEFCGVNPSLLALMTNAETYADYADDISGITVGEGAITKKFAFELWTGISAGACAPGEEASGYLLLPYVNAGLLGDLTVDGENAVTFGMTGAYTKGGNAWGVGPYDVLLNTGVPAPLPTPLDPLDHLLLVSTAVAPPPDACDPQAMPASAPVVPVTGITPGAPATLAPVGATVPADLTALANDANVGDVAWAAALEPAWATPGDYVLLGDASHAYWNGANWTAGDVA